MALLKELEGLPPYSTEAEAIRTVFDQVICLCAPDGGGITSAVVRDTDVSQFSEPQVHSSHSRTETITLTPRPLNEGGLEAWKLIRRVRSRLWRVAQLDPNHISSTRRDVEILVQDQMRRLKAGQDLDMLLNPSQAPSDYFTGAGREMFGTGLGGVEEQETIGSNDGRDSVTRDQGEGQEDAHPLPEVPFSYSSTFLEQTGTPYLDWHAWEALFGPLDS